MEIEVGTEVELGVGVGAGAGVGLRVGGRVGASAGIAMGRDTCTDGVRARWVWGWLAWSRSIFGKSSSDALRMNSARMK